MMKVHGVGWTEQMKQLRMRRRGQATVLTALAMVALLGFVGLALDGGNLYATRRQMQNAADASVFAGAAVLGSQGKRNSEVLAAVRDFAGRNGVTAPTDASQLRASYKDANDVLVGEIGNDNGNPPANARGVQVTATRQFRTFFLGVLRIPTARASATAAARATPQSTSGAGYAIWAQEQGRSPGDKVIDWSGSNTRVTGKIHTNSGADVGGSGNHVINSVIEHFTGFTGDDAKVQFTKPGREAALQQQTGPFPPMPVSWQSAEFSNASIPGSLAAEANAAGKYFRIDGDSDLTAYMTTVNGRSVLQEGLYYVTGKVSLGRSNVTGNVTIVSEGEIDFSGSDNQFTPFIRSGTRGDLLAFAGKEPPADSRYKDTVLNIGGSNVSYEGQIYAPRGSIGTSGSTNATVQGALIGMGVKLNGSNLNINAASMPGGTPAPPRIELYT